MLSVVGQPLGRRAYRRLVEWRLQLAPPVSVDHRTRYEPKTGLQVSLFSHRRRQIQLPVAATLHGLQLMLHLPTGPDLGGGEK